MLLSPAAKAGYADAQKSLGLMFENGKGVEVNMVEAVEWYQKCMLP
jgi:TPR repeat protein